MFKKVYDWVKWTWSKSDLVAKLLIGMFLIFGAVDIVSFDWYGFIESILYIFIIFVMQYLGARVIQYTSIYGDLPHD